MGGFSFILTLQIALLLGKLAWGGISYFEPKQALTQSLKEQATWVLRNHLIRFQEQRLIPNFAADSFCDIGHVPWLLCIIKGWSSWIVRFHFALLFYELMIHRSTFEGKPQWYGPRSWVGWTPCVYRFPSLSFSLIFSSCCGQLPGHLLTWWLWLMRVPMSLITPSQCTDGKT